MDILSVFDSFPGILEALASLFSFPLAKVDGHVISVGQVIKGVILMVMGYFLCRSLSAEIERKLLSRLDIDTALRHTLRTIIFYFLLVILTLFILRLLSIPITIFTVVGGALALGIGLGSQNIVNNFISGLVMMIERPVKMGDIIEVNGIAGRVEQIGARSTKIKTMSNTHVVIPNSSFLETNILNWTLSDDIVRLNVSVGVRYGTDSKDVEKLLLISTKDHNQILKFPQPVVLFKNFVDNALEFDLYVWVKVYDPMQRFKVESELRHTINTLFDENNIVIPFPQRDMHMYTDRPIQVSLQKKID